MTFAIRHQIKCYIAQEDDIPRLRMLHNALHAADGEYNSPWSIQCFYWALVVYPGMAKRNLRLVHDRAFICLICDSEIPF